jgi:hypothetical protein
MHVLAACHHHRSSSIASFKLRTGVSAPHCRSPQQTMCTESHSRSHDCTPLVCHSAGEEMHSLLARVYNIPFVSARNALYSLMYDDAALQGATGYSRGQLMQDAIHPTALGQALYGRGLIAYALKRMLACQLAALASTGDETQSAVGLSGCDGALLPAGVAAAGSVDASIRPLSPLAAREVDAVRSRVCCSCLSACSLSSSQCCP